MTKEHYYRDQMLLALFARRVYEGIIITPEKITLFNLKSFDLTV